MLRLKELSDCKEEKTAEFIVLPESQIPNLVNFNVQLNGFDDFTAHLIV